MRISNWSKFNENSNVSGELSHQMAQEIIYYFTEDSMPNKGLSNVFYDTFGETFVYYETGYEDLKQYVNDLIFKCRGDEDLNDKMIEMYHAIRKEREIFPEIYEIEENYFDLIDEENFDFMVHSSAKEYKIILGKDKKTLLEDFIRYCQILNTRMRLLQSSDYETILAKSNLTNGFRHDNSEYGFVHFEILLKRKVS